MANSNDEANKKTAQPPTATREENTAHPTMTALKPATNKSFLAAGAALIAVGALATSLYTFSLNQQLQNQLTIKNELLAQQLEKLAQQQDQDQAQVDQKIATKTNSIEDSRASLLAKFDELNKQVQTAMSQRFYQSQNWQLLKARYYLELAQINTHWSDSFGATIAMLQQADQLLQQLNEPKVFEIRQAIAKDIAQLQALPKLDVAGLLSQLDATQNSLNELNIPAMLSTDQSSTTETAPEQTKETLPVWRLHWQDSMNLLNKLVVIRRNDEQIKPLISPALEVILKESIRLNLQEAQWAILNNNPQVYQLVLSQAVDTLKKNFSLHAPNTAALVKKLTELQQVQLTINKPEIGSALPLLNQFIEATAPATDKTGATEPGGASQ